MLVMMVRYYSMWGMVTTKKKTHVSFQFCFEISFVGNTYKFCYEKRFVGNCYQSFCKIFCIKHFSQQILYEILMNFIIL